MVNLEPAALAIFCRRGVLAFLFIRLLAGVVPVWAATFNIDRTDDDATATACVDATPNDCSLRGAIIAANALPGADSINVPAGTYNLSIAGANEDVAATGDLDINDDLTITGADQATTIIDGGGIDRVFHILSGTIVEISGVTVRNGDVPVIDPSDAGGGIFNEGGTLTLTNSSIADNLAPFGGGISNRTGTLALINSTVIHNTAQQGGGILTGFNGTAELTNSTVSNNTAFNTGGGGIRIVQGMLTLTSSTISGNMATSVGSGDGGGIHIIAGFGSTVMITDSIIAGNTAARSGGGIANSGGTLSLTNSTVSGNTASSSAGGIQSGFTGSLTITNSTVSGNIAGGCCGGILSFHSSTVTSTTVSDNSAGTNGGGIGNFISTIRLKNSIVANSTSGGNCFGTITSLGNNLDSDGSCGLSDPTDISGVDPLLGPLADNGGPTFTHALLQGSLAIDAVPVVDCTDPDGNPLTTDQRGVARPQGVACDIGAFEFGPSPVEIDIKPGSDPNSINPRSKGLIPVAILTTSTADGDSLDFDAGDVDPLLVAFGPDGTSIAHSTGHLEDVDGDGDLDLLLHFKTQETGIACGDTEATLTGETFGGQAIEGTDSIKMAGCK